jgi:acyl-CoA hydrolase
MKEKAEEKLMAVQSELDATELEAKEDKERARNMIEVVTSEMRTLKKSLEEAEKREKQVSRNLAVETCLGNDKTV